MKIIITCEHATHVIPEKYETFYLDHDKILLTHEGWDIGALQIAEAIAPKSDFFYFANHSRLLIDLNRSLHHPKVFSSVSRLLTLEHKEEIIDQHYLPYRTKIEEKVADFISAHDSVLHLSVHSFTPELNGQIREAEIGLLYDSKRAKEKKFCAAWRDELEVYQRFRVRMNYPYKGSSDGFCTALRRQFKEKYIGMELEVNQAMLSNQKEISDVAEILSETFWLAVEKKKGE